MILVNELKEWIFFIISFIPGNLGKLFRRLIYFFLFKTSSKINIETGCEFICCENIRFKKNVSIGKNSFITAVCGKIIIGEKTVIGSGAHINADKGIEIIIGNDCIIGPNLMMRSSNHLYKDKNKLIREQGDQPLSIIIENNVWIGANVVILGNTIIKSGSIIAAGSVLFKEYDENSLIAGNPAQSKK